MIARRIPFLGGLSILAVVVHHSIMKWGSSVYQIVGEGSGNGMLTIYLSERIVRSLTEFAVPSFLFISGYFVAYASRGRSFRDVGKVVRQRILAIVVPYLVWQSAYLVNDWFFHDRARSAVEILSTLVTADNVALYYYVPLIIQCYALSVPLLLLIRTRPRLTLFSFCMIQVLTLCALYWRALGDPPSLVRAYAAIASHWAFIGTWALYFPFGISVGLNNHEFLRICQRHRLAIIAATASMALISVSETLWLVHQLGRSWTESVLRIPSGVYAVGFVASVISVPRLELPGATAIGRLSRHSYGIYLSHVFTLAYAERLARLVIDQLRVVLPPNMLEAGLFMVAILVIMVTLAGSLGVMWVVRKSPAKRLYAVLFG